MQKRIVWLWVVVGVVTWIGSGAAQDSSADAGAGDVANALPEDASASAAANDASPVDESASAPADDPLADVGASVTPSEPPSDYGATATASDLPVDYGASSTATPTEYGASATVKMDKRGPPVGAGDYRIEVGSLARVPRVDAQSLLTLSPGVLLTNEGGEGHASTMFLRGFNAGEGESVEMLLQGMPLNEVSNHHGHGYADVTFLAPELVRELRVVQGPFDPAQGDFAVAGTAEYELGLREPGLTVKGALGSFGRRRLFLGYRPEGERKATFLGVNFERGDGFGVNRAFGKASAVGQYEAKLGQGTFLRTLGFVAAQRWDTAGVIPEAAYRGRDLPCANSKDAQFFCTFDSHQGGSAQRAGLTTILERTRETGYLRAQAYVGVRGFRTRENFTGFTEDMREDGQLQRGDSRDGSTSALTLGFRELGRKRRQAFGHEQVIEAGVIGRYDVVDTAMDRVRRDAVHDDMGKVTVVGLTVPYQTDFDRGVKQTQVGAWLRGDVRPIDRLRLSVGGRADAFAFSVLDRNQPTVDRIGPRLPRERTDAYGFALSPRATVDLDVIGGVHWLTSVGGGARSSDATALSESESAPFARIWAGETGLAHTLTYDALELESRLSGFFTRVSRDLVFDPVSGRNQNVGTSQRAGMMAMLRGKFAHWLDLSASAAYTRAHLTPDSAGFVALTGPRVPFVPSWLVRTDAVVERPLPWAENLRGFAGVGLGYVGQRPLPNTEWTAPYTVLDLSAGVAYRMLELSTSVTNLFDARYRLAEYSYASNFDQTAPRSTLPARHFAAGAPLQWLVSLSVTAF